MSPFSLSVSNPASGHSGQSWKRIADALRGEGVSLTRKMPQIVSSRCVAAKLSGQRSSDVRDHHVGTQRWTAPNLDAGVGRRSSVVGRDSSSLCSITARKPFPVHARPGALPSTVDRDAPRSGLPLSQLYQKKHGGASHDVLCKRTCEK